MTDVPELDFLAAMKQCQEVTVLRHFGIIGLIYLTAALQSSVMTDELLGASWGTSRPYLPAVALVVIAASCEGTLAIVWSASLGLLLDGLSTERLGMQLSLASLFGLGLQLGKSLTRARGALVLTATVFGLTVMWRAMSPMTCAVLAGRVVDPSTVMSAAMNSAATTAVAGFVLIVLGRAIFGTSSRHKETAPGLSNRWEMLTG